MLDRGRLHVCLHANGRAALALVRKRRAGALLRASGGKQRPSSQRQLESLKRQADQEHHRWKRSLAAITRHHSPADCDLARLLSVRAVPLVLRADGFHDFNVLGRQRVRSLHRPRLLERAGIVDGDLHFQMA